MLYFENRVGKVFIINDYVHVKTNFYTIDIKVLDDNIAMVFLLAKRQAEELKVRSCN